MYIKEEMRKWKLTHKQVADHVGVTKYAVDSWCRDKNRTYPKGKDINKLKDLMPDIDPSKLYE